MRITVTGDRGFKGVHLVSLLVQQGYEVFGLDNRSNSADFFIQHPLYFSRCGDIRNEELVDMLVGDADAVIHLAAKINVDESVLKVKEYVDNNINGTVNVLDSCVRFKRKLIHIASSEIYGSAQYTPMDEGHPLGTQSPYAVTKLAADKLCGVYHTEYGLDVVRLRPFNCFGEGQGSGVYGGVIAKFIRSAFEGNPLTIYGTGLQKRDFCVTGDTKILTEGFIWKEIKDIKVGEKVISFDEVITEGARNFKISEVEKVSSYISNNVCTISTENGSVNATKNHPWLTAKGRFTETQNLVKRDSRIKKIGNPVDVIDTDGFKQGYVVGSMLGDGCCREYEQTKGRIYKTELAVTDKEYRDVFAQYCSCFNIHLNLAEGTPKYLNAKRIYIARSGKIKNYRIMSALLSAHDSLLMIDNEYCRGFMAGIFDAEGWTYGRDVRIGNKDVKIIDQICYVLDKFSFSYRKYYRKDGLIIITVTKGLQENIRFFSVFTPKIMRKYINIEERKVKLSDSRVIDVSDPRTDRVYNLQVKDSHTYIADGFLCHNTYVTDAVNAYSMALNWPAGEPINIGIGKSIAIIDIANLINCIVSRYTGHKVDIEYLPARPNEVQDLCADATRAHELGWKPLVSFEEGVRSCVEWYAKLYYNYSGDRR